MVVAAPAAVWQAKRIDAFAIHMPNARPYHEVVLAPARKAATSCPATLE